MIVYRLSRKLYCNDLSGKGAELAGGRWNSKGTAVLYTSESIALCTVEIAVHMPLGIVPKDYHLITIELPDSGPLGEVHEKDLAASWKSFPHSNATQKIGDRYVAEGASLILKVPSATVQGTFNYLVNPRHPDFQKVRILKTEPFVFDKRLFIK
ncbi:RES family NAD+ phosphorylase [Pontibacter lucknowensis]|uniref:RES domain-containing protein n=1 Tax=Pontibacter lucknowensis TaxID=1077936 RepID=A0A1N6X1X4_9BACT|nr:RES family NAD+ phosphorylase [Pontibacter lucknowensis]SIQ96251.1 RES domain-containing protein [Pontibacter lucknowensis]